jgi:hypothetical protein
MPRAYAMTYVPRDATWKKMFRGKTYFVSCLALGCEQTKEGSWQAANAWWKIKKNELAIDKSKSVMGSLESVTEMCNEWAGREVLPGEVPVFVSEMIETSFNAKPEIQTKLWMNLLGETGFKKLAEGVEMGKRADLLVKSALEDEPVMTDTVQHAIKKWLDLLQVKVGNGKLSPASFDNYQRQISHFEAFIGSFSPISAINEATIEAYYVHISKIDNKQSLKKLRFEVARMFIRKISIDGTINPPRNLSSRDFSFQPDFGKKVTWTLEQFKSVYGASRGLRRLCVLLAANCCFHAEDMANLSGTIDWEAGTITKGRKKTEKRYEEKTTWFLWPETLELLKQHHSELPALASKKLYTDEKTGKTKLRKVLRPEASGLKQLRTTTIDFLTNSEYKPWADYYAGESSKTMIDKFYGSTWLDTCKKLSDYVYSRYFPVS